MVFFCQLYLFTKSTISHQYKHTLFGKITIDTIQGGNAMQQQNQQMGQQAGQSLPQPPNMISPKDLLYLSDMLTWNLNAAKKAHFFASQCTIPEVSNALEQVCQMHEKHYNMLLQHLNQTQNPQSMM